MLCTYAPGCSDITLNNMFDKQYEKGNAGECSLTTLILIVGKCSGDVCTLPFCKHRVAFIERTKHIGKSLTGSKSLAGLLSVKALHCTAS